MGTKAAAVSRGAAAVPLWLATSAALAIAYPELHGPALTATALRWIVAATTAAGLVVALHGIARRRTWNVPRAVSAIVLAEGAAQLAGVYAGDAAARWGLSTAPTLASYVAVVCVLAVALLRRS
jgi:predicted permease